MSFSAPHPRLRLRLLLLHVFWVLPSPHTGPPDGSLQVHAHWQVRVTLKTRTRIIESFLPHEHRLLIVLAVLRATKLLV